MILSLTLWNYLNDPELDGVGHEGLRAEPIMGHAPKLLEPANCGYVTQCGNSFRLYQFHRLLVSNDV